MREVVGDAPDRRVEILCDDPALNVTWSRFGPGRDGADLHVHREHTDAFFVLEGELTVKLATGEVTVPAGSLARVPPMVVHGFRNASDADVKYLNFHAPGCGFADYMRGLRDFDQLDPPGTGTRPATDAVITDGPLYADTEHLRVEEGTRAGDAWFYVLEGDDAGTWGRGPAEAPRLLIVG